MSQEDLSRWEDEGGFSEPEIPKHIQTLLSQILYPRAWQRWMNTNIPALQGRTPWECVDGNDSQAVVDLLKSYQDPSFG